MKIAIDLDGVVFNSEMFFMASGELYDAMILGKNSIVKPDEPRVQNKYSWSDEELQGYIERYSRSLDFDVMPCAKIVIDELKRDNELFVVSARGQFSEEEITIARRKLDEAGITFHHYFFGHLDKRQIVRDLGIDVMIDDRYDVCEDLSRMGVLSLYFRMAGRRELEESELVKEVNNWGEVYRVLRDRGIIGGKNEED